MNNPKAKKDTKKIKTAPPEVESPAGITSKEELKTFLQRVKDKMEDSQAAPLYAATAMNHVLNLSNISDLLDNENRELARDVWLRIKQAGMQVRNPPILFKPEEDGLGTAS